MWSLSSLRENLDIGTARMHGYAAAKRLSQPVALCGWSMGGLVVLQAAPTVNPHSVILLEPSPPAEIQGLYPDVPLHEGTFDPEEAYGRFPPGQTSRPESLLARAERKRDVSIPEIASRSFVIYGKSFPEEQGRRIAALFGSEEAYFPGLDHWALVPDPGVRGTIAEFLGLRCQTGPSHTVAMVWCNTGFVYLRWESVQGRDRKLEDSR